MGPDINHILRVYLGCDENGGYEPLYRDERMQDTFGDRHAEMLDRIRSYLAEDREPDREGDLLQQSNAFEIALREKFPELEPNIARALANRWHFDWSR